MASLLRSLLAWGALTLLASVLGSGALAAEPRTLLVLGDSLSAAFGIDVESGWVRLLEQRLARESRHYRVVNASISGDTSANGLARLPRLLADHRPAVVVIELGGNDGLRGRPVEELERNLVEMARRARDGGARVLLVGVELPPNYGRRYVERFRAAYQAAARATQTPLVPSILSGIGGDRALMQADGIHPTAGAQPRMLDNVWPRLRPLL